MEFAAQAGVWNITQDGNTKRLTLSKYGVKVAEYDADKMYSFDELFEILCNKSFLYESEVKQ